MQSATLIYIAVSLIEDNTDLVLIVRFGCTPACAYLTIKGGARVCKPVRFVRLV